MFWPVICDKQLSAYTSYTYLSWKGEDGYNLFHEGSNLFASFILFYRIDDENPEVECCVSNATDDNESSDWWTGHDTDKYYLEYYYKSEYFLIFVYRISIYIFIVNILNVCKKLSRNYACSFYFHFRT